MNAAQQNEDGTPTICSLDAQCERQSKILVQKQWDAEQWDAKLTSDPKDYLGPLLPKYIFSFLVCSGAIRPQKECCCSCCCSCCRSTLCCLRTFWILSILLIFFVAVYLCEALGFHFGCVIDQNCILQTRYKQENARSNALVGYGAAAVIAIVLEVLGDAISIIMVHTVVRNLLTSPEFKRLVSIPSIREKSTNW